MFYVGDTSLSKAALDVETQTAIVGVAFSHVTISFYSIYAVYHDPAIWICTSVKEIQVYTSALLQWLCYESLRSPWGVCLLSGVCVCVGGGRCETPAGNHLDTRQLVYGGCVRYSD